MYETLIKAENESREQIFLWRRKLDKHLEFLIVFGGQCQNRWFKFSS